MPGRISTASFYTSFLSGLRSNQTRLYSLQLQAGTGQRIQRPSDDAAGMARVLGLNRSLADTERLRQSIQAGKGRIDVGAARLQDASGILAEVRSLVILAMNGVQSPEDRKSIAKEIELLREQLLEIANSRFAGQYVFNGTDDGAPWQEQIVNGEARASYVGNSEELAIRIGVEVTLALNVPGDEIFGKLEPTGTLYSGLTGASSGQTADSGTGYELLQIRHDATVLDPLNAAGVAVVNGGAGDTFVGPNALVVDAAAGTVRLGSGPAVPFPQPGDPDAADFVVENELGGELHLDFSGFTGTSYSGIVTGDASASLDGSSFVPLDFVDQDLRLTNPGTGTVLHLDTTGIRRAGTELVHFAGAVNLFDVLQGIATDLSDSESVDSQHLLERLSLRLDELDRNHDNLLISTGVLGSRSARLTKAEANLSSVSIELEALRSGIRDADLSEVLTELAQTQNVLQTVQAVGVRLVQTSLLNFLG